MQILKFVLDGMEAEKNLINMIVNAKYNIFITSWYFDLQYKFNEHNTIHRLLLKKADQGVIIYIMTSAMASEDITNSNMKLIKKYPHNNLYFKIISTKAKTKTDNKERWLDKYFLSYFTKLIENGTDQQALYQRYILVDNMIAMFNLTDVNNSLKTSIKNNIADKNDRYWIESGFIFKPDTGFLDFVYRNFVGDGKAIYHGADFVGNFYKINTSYTKTLNMIKGAQEFIMIQNQYIISHEETHNDVIKFIADKIIEMYEIKKEFKVVILTNKSFPDACNKTATLYDKCYCQIYSHYNSNNFSLTIKYLINYLEIHGIPKNKIGNYIRIYTVSDNILMHSKVISVDHKKMLLGTTNIMDASYRISNISNIDAFIDDAEFVKENEIKMLEQFSGNKKLDIDSIFQFLDKIDCLEIYQVHKE